MFESLRHMDRHHWNAALAGFLGWALDAFDFFLMVFMFTAIAKEFHAQVAAVAAASAVTLAARPFGALFFGLLADRYGRRPVLIADVVAFSVLELASAFAPNLAVLIILRALFGFAMGGEWGVGASLAMESIPPKARGLISGLLQEGYAVGYLLAALIFYLLFARIGWRGMFVVGLAPALLAGFISLGVKESPAFEARRASLAGKNRSRIWLIGLCALAVAMVPSIASAVWPGHLLGLIYGVDVPVALVGLWFFRRFWKLGLYLVGLMTVFNLFSHGTQDLYPTFLTHQHHLGPGAVGPLTAIGNVGALVGGVSFGALSERFGRRRAIVAAALGALIVIPLWAFSASLALLAAGAFLIQVMVQGAWGVVPAHLNELAPGAERGVFPGYVYQLGNLLASGLIVWQARFAEAPGGSYSAALALTAAIVAVLVAAMTLFGPERRGADFALMEAPPPA
jgi:SHS family lactate transporter-like MFS transporter